MLATCASTAVRRTTNAATTRFGCTRANSTVAAIDDLLDRQRRQRQMEEDLLGIVGTPQPAAPSSPANETLGQAQDEGGEGRISCRQQIRREVRGTAGVALPWLPVSTVSPAPQTAPPPGAHSRLAGGQPNGEGLGRQRKQMQREVRGLEGAASPAQHFRAAPFPQSAISPSSLTRPPLYPRAYGCSDYSSNSSSSSSGNVHERLQGETVAGLCDVILAQARVIALITSRVQLFDGHGQERAVGKAAGQLGPGQGSGCLSGRRAGRHRYHAAAWAAVGRS